MRISDWSSDVCSSDLADPGQHASLIGRLRTLSRLGLAEEGKNGRWTLDRELESRLRRMGERGDIIRTLNRALARAGIHRPPQNHALFDPALDTAIIGRVVATGLSDEHRDRRYLIIDGLDGRSEEHTSELQSLMRNSYAVFCLQKKTQQ